MNWQGKEIKELSDLELLAAKQKLLEMEAFKDKQQANPKFAQKFINQPMPIVNPKFTNLMNEVNSEIEIRGL